MSTLVNGERLAKYPQSSADKRLPVSRLRFTTMESKDLSLLKEVSSMYLPGIVRGQRLPCLPLQTLEFYHPGTDSGRYLDEHRTSCMILLMRALRLPAGQHPPKGWGRLGQYTGKPVFL